MSEGIERDVRELGVTYGNSVLPTACFCVSRIVFQPLGKHDFRLILPLKWAQKGHRTSHSILVRHAQFPSCNDVILGLFGPFFGSGLGPAPAKMKIAQDLLNPYLLAQWSQRFVTFGLV